MEVIRYKGVLPFEQVGVKYQAEYRVRQRGRKANEGAGNYQSLLAVCRVDDGFVVGSDTRIAKFDDNYDLISTQGQQPHG